MYFKCILIAGLLLLISGVAFAETSTNLPDVVRQAISENPEVQASWHAFLAASEQQTGAKGGYFPSLALTAGTGWEKWDLSDSKDEDFTRANVALSLRQMIFDGFATRNEVARLGYAKLVRYYEFLATSENIALETTRAYLDVMLYRELKKLAEENYIQHRNIFNRVQNRVEAGVSRGVDLEQASGRLALAESNFITESTNLYDVSSRFLRIVDHAPPAILAPPEALAKGLPSDQETGLKQAFQENPSFNAAVEKVHSAEAEKRVSRAPFMPRVDLQGRQNFGRSSGDLQDRDGESIVELVLNYNLFAGGSDMAAKRQALQQLKVAKAQREQACRNIRQEFGISYNDKQSLEQQLQYLNEHQLAAGKARKAYQDQFAIGQRTLLDLLDTQNEYFEARRAYVSTSYAYTLADARTLASMGRLLNGLQVSHEALPTAKDLGQDRIGIDPDAICTPDTIEADIEFPTIPALIPREKVVVPTPPVADNSQNDADGDSVPDQLDACANTPHGTEVDKFGCPKRLPEQFSFQVNVFFSFASSTIPENYRKEVLRLAEFLRQHPTLKVAIEGHTDAIGSEKFNQWLSQKRADSVRQSLIKNGIAPERLQAIGYGEKRPVSGNMLAGDRKQNRRVVAVPMAAPSAR